MLKGRRRGKKVWRFYENVWRKNATRMENLVCSGDFAAKMG